jgi:hypothetical protein
MATRAARVSTEHVQALNMIDLVFYGSHVLGIHRRMSRDNLDESCATTRMGSW